jgi:hypothetical protein
MVTALAETEPPESPRCTPALGPPDLQARSACVLATADLGRVLSGVGGGLFRPLDLHPPEPKIALRFTVLGHREPSRGRHRSLPLVAQGQANSDGPQVASPATPRPWSCSFRPTGSDRPWLQDPSSSARTWRSMSVSDSRSGWPTCASRGRRLQARQSRRPGRRRPAAPWRCHTGSQPPQPGMHHPDVVERGRLPRPITHLPQDRQRQPEELQRLPTLPPTRHARGRGC